MQSGNLLARASQVVDEAPENVCLIRLSPIGWGAITKQEIASLMGQGRSGLSLGSALSSGPLPYLHPDHSLDMALRYIDRWPVLPVVSRADFSRLEGLITKHKILEKYRDFKDE